MKVMEHPATTAFGAVTIGFLAMLAPLASPTHSAIYHLVGPVSAVLVPSLLNFVGFWALLTLLLAGGRAHPRLNTVVWSILAICLPWLLLKSINMMTGLGTISRAFNLIYLALLSLAIVLILRSRKPRLTRSTRKIATIVLGFAALSGIFLWAETFYYTWQARDLNAQRPLHQQAFSDVRKTPRGHIIWIVLDELSYRQIYEHRYAALQLPAFDQLAKTSTVFTNVVPAGMFTDVVLPSLISGIPLDKVHKPATGWPLEIHDFSTQRWEQLDPHNTVFQDALDAGYSTGVAGWFNPYCRIIPEVLDHCFWTNHFGLAGGFFPGQSIAWNAEQPVLRRLVSFSTQLGLMHGQGSSATGIAFHQKDYTDLLDAGDKLLADPSVNFLLLHMPIPHPGGIYNRRTHSFDTVKPSYVDNLALCDVYLAHVREELEQAGAWDDTALVVMGDHSWRVQLEGRSPEWTIEDQIASEGAKFDSRPAYIVKLPHQTEPYRVETAFAAIRTRELFKNLMTGRVATPQQLAIWSQQNADTAQPVGIVGETNH
jgi:Sulfatase